MNPVKITQPENCGNSPKARLLAEFNAAFARGDSDWLLAHVTDDVHWRMVGQEEAHGKAAFAEMAAGAETLAEIGVTGIITHGRTGAVEGWMRMKDGRRFAFCETYTFSSAKGETVRAINSYVIQTD